MCHWALRVWKCGDSFFTKYSSCSFDRAAHDPANLLNPLHPSITPFGIDGVEGSKQKGKDKKKVQAKARTGAKKGAGDKTSLSGQVLPTIDISSASNTHATQMVYPRDAQTGETIPVPLSEIGKASRFGDRTLSERSKCNVFEVVLQTREPTVCPACARSPKRARLPAHARGCFGMN